MTVGITAYGAYVPRLRLRRDAVSAANAWFAPNLRGKGQRSMTNWDEDSITMAVAAARDALGGQARDAGLGQVILASNTLPFAERLNASIVAGAMDLTEEVACVDLTGSQSAALSAFGQACASAQHRQQPVLLAAADNRKTRVASAQELSYGDGAAAVVVGTDNVIAEVVGHAELTVDFVDHFRGSGQDIDYHWEERWVRDEGIATWMPRAVKDALTQARVAPGDIDHFIFPTTFRKADAQLAKQCGIPAEAVVGNLGDSVGDTGIAHGLLMLAQVLETAKPGQTILLTQFGSGVQTVVLRVTAQIEAFKPARGVSGWLARGTEETNYTRFLFYKGQLDMEAGMRGEQDKKTALSTLYRHRRALTGLVAGRCRETGEVSFPPSRLSYTEGAPKLDTQEPYPLADRVGSVLSWSAEALSFYRAPPHHYGQIDFEGGGRILMEFTDVHFGEVKTGMAVEMAFRVKDLDEARGFRRYFWKAVPLNPPTTEA